MADLTAEQRAELEAIAQGQGAEANGAAPAEQGERSSWAPMDLGPVLAGANPVRGPALLARSDGECLLYRERLHSVSSEPESGKGWLTLYAAAEQLAAGEDVLLVDFEDGPAAIVERLRALGVEDGAIAERFHYARPEEPLDERGWAEMAGALDRRPSLIVLDGVTEALALHGLDLRDNSEVAEWLQIPRRLGRTGAAVVLIDHVVKDRETRGRWAIGAQHKLAGVDVAYTLKVREPFARGRDGLVQLHVKKDRPGYVRGLAEGEHLADLRLRSTGEEVRIVLDPPEDGEGFRPTLLMERICEAVAFEPGLSKSDVRRAVNGKHDAKDLALRLLVAEGYMRVEREGQAQRHYVEQLYTAADDPKVPGGSEDA